MAALPSLRPGKLRLNEETMVFTSFVPTSERFHWPMQGPHALASTVPPICSKVAHDAVALDGLVDALGARRDQEGGLGLEAGLERLGGDVGGALHVLVGGVRARADERGLDRRRASPPSSPRRRVRLGPRAVGRVRAHDVRLELGQVDLDHLVVVFLRDPRGPPDPRRDACGGPRRARACHRDQSRGDRRPCGRRSGTARWWRRAPRPCCRWCPCRWR